MQKSKIKSNEINFSEWFGEVNNQNFKLFIFNF